MDLNEKIFKAYEKILAENKKEIIVELSGKRQLNFNGVDEVGTFYVVTEPSEYMNELLDIFFEANIFDMHLQFLGGLKGSEIVGIYKNKGKAMKKAKELIKQSKGE